MFDEKTKIALKYYVYLLIDPAGDKPFYIGKGKDNRVFDHVRQNIINEDQASLKYLEIQRIGPENVKHVIIRHGLTEKESFLIESCLIDTLKFIPDFNSIVKGNIQGGINAIEKGLMTTDDITRLYNAEPLENIADDCLIININKTFSRGLGSNAIYKATKETWSMKKSRQEKVKFILSEYRGLIVEVFKVDNWYEKERGYNKGAKKYGETYIGYGFNGSIATQDIREKYLNKSISKIKQRGFGGVLIFPETFEKLKRSE
jgi:hypothetical protein